MKKSVNYPGIKRPVIQSFFLVLFLITSFATFAQVNIRGKVSDSSGENLIGVNVIIKDSRQGTVTDIDGNFSLSVPSANSTLVFSYVGFTE